MNGFNRMLLILGGVTLVALIALRVTGGTTGSLQSTVGAKSEGTMGSNQSERVYSKSGYDVTPLSPQRVAELEKTLSPQERRVLREQCTDAAFSGGLVENKATGVYTCRLCGLPLYESKTKFESGTGWPSFFQPVDPMHVRMIPDTSHGMTRTEVVCARCGSHLGHVFTDGPQPTGQRFCMNSSALRFFETGAALPVESRPASLETAYFAGGCFWGVEDRFQQVPGVVEAISGYSGGTTSDPTYQQVCGHGTGHAETVKVVFDATKVRYGQLLEWFFKFHDPTQRNRQGPDVGDQYRSAIFVVDDGQFEQAKSFIQQLQASDRFRGREIVTQVERAGRFYEAEEYHQDYHAKHGGSCTLPTD